MAQDTVDFSLESEVDEVDLGNEIAAKASGKKQTKQVSDNDAGEFLNETNESVDNNEGERTATILYEDDNFIFTSEGVVDKASLNTKTDNSSDAEPKDEKIAGKFNSYDDLIKSYKELEKKMGESSEAVNKLRELNPVLPMLEAMLSDDAFLQLAEDYFTNPTAQSEALKKQLGIGDDFVFDLNNALSDPKSDDAKVLNKLMLARQPKQPQSSQTKTQTTQADTKAEEEFMKKHGLSQEEYDDMMKKAQDYKITYEDIYLIMNKDKVLADAQKKGQSAVKKQVEVAQSIRKSRSGGGETPKLAPEDAFMNAIAEGRGLFD